MSDEERNPMTEDELRDILDRKRITDEQLQRLMNDPAALERVLAARDPEAVKAADQARRDLAATRERRDLAATREMMREVWERGRAIAEAHHRIKEEGGSFAAWLDAQGISRATAQRLLSLYHRVDWQSLATDDE
jgi:hypothetical protein